MKTKVKVGRKVFYTWAVGTAVRYEGALKTIEMAFVTQDGKAAYKLSGSCDIHSEDIIDPIVLDIVGTNGYLER